jgi:hypothetical protein
LNVGFFEETSADTSWLAFVAGIQDIERERPQLRRRRPGAGQALDRQQTRGPCRYPCRRPCPPTPHRTPERRTPPLRGRTLASEISGRRSQAPWRVARFLLNVVVRRRRTLGAATATVARPTPALPQETFGAARSCLAKPAVRGLAAPPVRVRQARRTQPAAPRAHPPCVETAGDPQAGAAGAPRRQDLRENRTLIPADARGQPSQATLARGPRSVQGLTRRGRQQPAAPFAAVHAGCRFRRFI